MARLKQMHRTIGQMGLSERRVMDYWTIRLTGEQTWVRGPNKTRQSHALLPVTPIALYTSVDYDNDYRARACRHLQSGVGVILSSSCWNFVTASLAFASCCCSFNPRQCITAV